MLAWNLCEFPATPAPDTVGPRQTALRRLRAEFTEMPGLSLTVAQAERLCGLTNDACQWALDALVAEGVLRKSASGCYVRA